MKKVLKILWKPLVFFLPLVMGGGCQVDIDEIHTRDPVTRDADAVKIMEAQTWLENNAALTSKTEATWRYYWEMAFNESSENWETVEIPLEFLEMPATVLPENLDKFNETGDHKYLVNSMRAIVATNTETGEVAGFFMNVVPSLHYLQEKTFDSFSNSYLDRDEDFDGLVQFYSLEGEFINGWIYTEGAITGALVSKTDIAGTEDAKSGSENDGWFWYCTTTMTHHFVKWYNEHTDEYWYTIYEGTTFDTDCELVMLTVGGEEGDISWIDGPGGGGLSGYLIIAGVSPAGAGTVSDGSQTVFPGSSVLLSATPSNAYEFSHWETSDEQLSLPPQPTVTFTPTGSMFVTAVFSQLYPCEENGGYAPLLGGLQVTSTSGQGVFGGLFDAHRYGSGNHRGIDISGPVGTPIFAMAGGTIVGGGLFVTGQPNRQWDPSRNEYVYPSGYADDDNDAGNRIYILSTCGNYQYAYWHLDADNPLGINRNTGEPWAPGDTVEPGDWIGAIGLTGNAIGGDPHLHFGVRRTSDWEWINPAYKFPSFFQNPDPNTGNLTIPCE